MWGFTPTKMKRGEISTVFRQNTERDRQCGGGFVVLGRHKGFRDLSRLWMLEI